MDYANINVILQKGIGTCNGRNGGNNHSKCSNSVDLINNAINNNININVPLLCKYISDLMDVTSYRGYRYGSYRDRCLIKNKDKIKVLFKNIFANYPTFFNEYYGVEVKIMDELLTYVDYDECYDSVDLPLPLKFDEKHPFFNAIIKRLSSDYNSGTNHIPNFVIKNTNMTPEVITRLCSCKNEMLANFLSGIIDKTDAKFDESIMSNACLSLPFTKQIIQSLVSRNIEITNKDIINVLTNCSAESIEFVFELASTQKQLVITKDHYVALLNSTTQKNDRNDTRYASLNNDGTVCKLNNDYEIYLKKLDDNYTVDKMSILLKYGFVLDKDDVLLSIRYKKEIPMIELFGVALDDNFLKLCQANNFYPKYNFKCISQELFELQSLCLVKNLPKIRAFLKKHNTVVPDSVCMENASSIIRNEKTLALLIGAGGIVTKKCLTNYMQIFRDPQMSLLLNDLFKNDVVK